MSLSIASNTSYEQRNNHRPPAADFCTTESMYNKFANVTTPHCYFPASWLTFSAFAAAMASFRFCTLPDSMAFLSALAACIDRSSLDRSSQYALNIRKCIATGHFRLLVEKTNEEMYEQFKTCTTLAFLAKKNWKLPRQTTRKICSTFQISFTPNEHLQKTNKKTVGILDLAFWQHSTCQVDMKTLKSPKDEMTSRYQTFSPCHTVLISFAIPSSVTFCQKKYSEVLAVMNPQIPKPLANCEEEKTAPVMAPPLLKSPWHKGKSLRYGMGC